MFAGYRIVDRTRFFRVLRRFLKYFLFPPFAIALLLTIFLSYVAVDHNAGGYYCEYYSGEGHIYRGRQECSVEIGRLSEFSVNTAVSLFVLLVLPSAVFGFGFYILYVVYSHRRLGFGKAAGGDA